MSDSDLKNTLGYILIHSATTAQIQDLVTTMTEAFIIFDSTLQKLVFWNGTAFQNFTFDV